MFSWLINQLAAQHSIPPKREFRGAWVATVTNIDFPSVPGLDEERFMKEWIGIMDFLQEAGFNAVLAQVRPAGDAFYRSKISPWSKYLTGQQGREPLGNFDPLAFMIEEAHSRNMELHAWLNPYRASMDTTTATLSSMHPYKHHPEWFLRYGGKMYFNPAMPEVRNYITEIVMELVMEYDVDGIHFDDYFYPYPSAGELFPDSQDFARFGYGFYNIDDWRRNNVDQMISQVSQMLKVTAPHVKFGISPFGVWRNVSKDPQLGSATRAGINTYDDLFADVRGWLEKGWIDYVAPQLYWNIGFAVADYEVLLKWWQKNSFGRNLYAGLAAYKVDNNPEPAWKNPGEIPRQIRLNRSSPGVQGCIFYNTNSLIKNPLHVVDSLKNTYFNVPALLPEMPYLGLPIPAAPKLSKPKFRQGTASLTCTLDEKSSSASYLIIYRFEDRLPGDFNNPLNIFRIIRLNGEKSVTFEDKDFVQGKFYTYSVSAVNRQHSEGPLSNWRTVFSGKKRLSRVK
jgi:uncharacterized lipoprotein YddW (UPF0748 family)